MPRASRAEPTTWSTRPRQLLELNLGATAVGTGLNAGDDYTPARRAEPEPLYRDRSRPPRRIVFA